MGNRIGRPSLYTEELAEEILERIAAGESVTSICRDEHMPDRSTVFEWADPECPTTEVPADFSDRYKRARRNQAFGWLDESIDIVDDATNDYVEKKSRNGGSYMAFDAEHVQRSKLRIEHRKYLVERCLGQQQPPEQTITHNHRFVDAPPEETREQWEARRLKEIEEGQ